MSNTLTQSSATVAFSHAAIAPRTCSTCSTCGLDARAWDGCPDCAPQVRCGACGVTFTPDLPGAKCLSCEAEYAEMDALCADYLAEQSQIESERIALIQAEAERERLDAEGMLKRPLPNYCDGVHANRAEYLSAQGLLFGLCRAANMDMSKRIEGAARYLQIPISSWKQLSPNEMHALRLAILGGYLSTDWELAQAGQSACDWERLSTVDEEDFARICD